MGDCYELLFQFLTTQQSTLNRLQQEELDRLHLERQAPSAGDKPPVIDEDEKGI